MITEATTKIKEALKAFKENRLVSIPTETVYGLAAPIDRLDLVEKIFKLKERPLFDPLICHVSDSEQAKKYVSSWPKEAELLSEVFWPGPLTLVLPKKSELVDNLITSGLETVGLRSPANDLSLELIRALDVPLAAPSANKFTQTSPTSPEHVKNAFKADDVLVLEGGECQVGIESTIVSIDQEGVIEILRLGMITKEEIVDKTGLKVRMGNLKEQSKTPGSHHVHYRPKYSMSYCLKSELTEEISPETELVYLDNEPELVARKLYALFHQPLQKNYKKKLFIVPDHQEGDQRWEAILNRLIKASTKEP